MLVRVYHAVLGVVAQIYFTWMSGCNEHVTYETWVVDELSTICLVDRQRPRPKLDNEIVHYNAVGIITALEDNSFLLTMLKIHVQRELLNLTPISACRYSIPARSTAYADCEEPRRTKRHARRLTTARRIGFHGYGRL